MNQSKIAIRYARAVFQTSVEAGTLDKVKEDFGMLDHFIRTDEVFKYLLSSPLVSSHQKNTVFINSFGQHFSPVSIEFLKLLSRNRRELHLDAVIRHFNELYMKYKGLLSVEVHSVSSVSEELKKKIREVVQERFHKQVQFKEFINPELIGGFIMQVEDLRYDASVSSQLKNMKDKLTSKTNE
jgi:F-type H+-transporting ATPase subunit delta